VYDIRCGGPDVSPVVVALAVVGARLTSLEAPGLSRGDNEIDRATAALRADEASGPISDGKIGTIARCLFAGIDINVAPAGVAPGPQ
jgi:hypothetical protein